MLTAWGNFPPTGFFEGTYGDIGSFHGCVNVPENEAIGHAHYCTIAYRPVMPKRADYELIINKEPDELLHLFDRHRSSLATDDVFKEIVKHSQYNHYVYYKFGTCFPIGCSPHDVQRLAKLLGRKSILMSGPVKCHSKFHNDYDEHVAADQVSGQTTALQISTRDLNDGVYIWKPHVTRAQWISLLVVGVITAAILVFTLLDIFINRRPLDFSCSASTTSNPPEAQVQNGSLGAVSWWVSGEVIDSNNNNNGSPSTPKHANGHDHSYYELQTKNRTGQVGKEEDGARLQAGLLGERGEQAELENGGSPTKQRSLLMELIGDCSIVTNVKQFFRVSQSQLDNDILCIHGIRCITMSWIIITHTMQYNDWSAFARIREIETHLKSLINQPLFNGSYLVDSFFLVSGLLASYSSFKPKPKVRRQEKGKAGARAEEDASAGELSLRNFSSRSYLIGRYLRLTPQVVFVSLLFILLPLVSRSGGPHWYTITGEYSENCSQNWWLNLFYIQAFYRQNEMCNFVCWWISVDMFYHLFGLAVILTTLYLGHAAALLSCSALIIGHGLVQATKHYQLALPPNLLSTIPQTGAMWSQMTLESFWTPYAHAFPFFLGFYLGYLLATRRSLFAGWFTRKRALSGWLIAISLLVCQSYSTYFWVIGTWNYTRPVSTLFYLVCPIVWASCLSWIIVACHHGYGAWINRVLSCKLFIILSKASYVVYLSHFIILFTFFGSQNLLLEPTRIVMSYVIIGNITLSMLLGSFLCVVYETPWLKIQKRLMKHIS